LSGKAGNEGKRERGKKGTREKGNKGKREQGKKGTRERGNKEPGTSVVSLKFIEELPQILRLTTSELKGVRGPVRSE
jgi:hypothetical protein